MNNKIILIGPLYFSYIYEIAKKLNHLKYEVEVINDKPFNSNIIKFTARYFTELTSSIYFLLFKFFYTKKIKEVGLIIIIIGECINSDCIHYIKKINPKIRIIYYTWDSLKNKPKIRSTFDVCDVVYSFDRQDAKAFKVKYLPLFYVEDFEYDGKTKANEVVFIGTLHSDRLNVLALIEAEISGKPTLKKFIYCQSKFVFYFRKYILKTLGKISSTDISYKNLSLREVAAIYKRSRYVIDIHHPRQSGMTMRTFEALAAHCKLITTNQCIVNEPFFNAKNILVVDRLNLNLDKSFFLSEYESSINMSDYSIESWVKKLIAHA